MGLPCVVLYRMSTVTYQIGRLLVNVEHFSLPNILLGKRVEPELLQDEVEPSRIAAEAERLLEPTEAERVRACLLHVKERLGEAGAAARIAMHILNTAKKGEQQEIT